MDLLNQIRERTYGKQIPVVVALEGVIGSGKTYTARVLAESLAGNAIVLPVDSFCRIPRDEFQAFMAQPDFALRNMYDFEKIRQVLTDAKARKRFTVTGGYNLANGKLDYVLAIDASSAELVILEGLFSFDDVLKDLVDVRVFVEVPEEVALTRAEQRDRTERNADTEQWLRKKWLFHDLYQPYTEKARASADIIHTNNLELNS